MNANKYLFWGGIIFLFVTIVFPANLWTANPLTETVSVEYAPDNMQSDNGLMVQGIGSIPLAFTKNMGQWDQQALFCAYAGDATIWFTREGVYHQFRRHIPRIVEAAAGRQISASDPRKDLVIPNGRGFNREPDSVETMAFKVTFVGANPNPEVVGENLIEYKCNYFMGNDPGSWLTDVPNYKAICLNEVYPGIDLRYHGSGSQLEYDFVVAPGADPARIAIRYEGILSLSVGEDGALAIETEWGKVFEKRPVVYQTLNGVRKPIEGEYLLIGNNSFGFTLGTGYDPALPVIIDPELVYGTHLGGSDEDRGYGTAVDHAGNMYITGYSLSSDFPVVGEYQADQGDRDAFVTKLNIAGNALVYSSYLGGSGSDCGLGICVDGSGNAYVAGGTFSSDFPMVEEFQTYQGNYDAFVTKLNDSGNSLIYSTCLGGSDVDCGYGIAIDGLDNAYITGWVSSTDFPQKGAYQTDQDTVDAFVTKLNSTGDDVVYSTYLGGSDFECGLGIAVDNFGNAYVVGGTESPDFPLAGEYQTYQGSIDVFVVKLNNFGDDLVYGTFLGGSDQEYGFDIGVDGPGSAYVTGWTMSANFPTRGAYQMAQDGVDAFVTKLSTTGGDLAYSTYLGGSASDNGLAICVDGFGNAYITGFTQSDDFPKKNKYQGYQGNADVFVTKMNISGNGLVYSTYLGGSNDEFGWGIAADGSGDVYIAGSTTSSDFPTQGGYQPGQEGGEDIFAAKLSECYCGISGDIDNNGDASPADVTFMVNYVYKSVDGRIYPASWNCPYDLGDLDCSGGLPNPVDVLYLVNYVYKSLNAVCHGCGW